MNELLLKNNDLLPSIIGTFLSFVFFILNFVVGSIYFSKDFQGVGISELVNKLTSVGIFAVPLFSIIFFWVGVVLSIGFSFLFFFYNKNVLYKKKNLFRNIIFSFIFSFLTYFIFTLFAILLIFVLEIFV